MTALLVAVGRVLMGIAALALLAALCWAMTVAVLTLALIARDRIEDALCSLARRRRHRRGRL